MLSGDQLLAALTVVFSLQGILIVLQGTLLAMITSFLPGIGGTGIAVLIMLATLNWSPEHALLLFSALTGGATFMGSITAILFRIPGNTPSAASLLDGYPLAQKGYPKTAIACAATASALGSIIGVALLVLILPVASKILFSIGSFELLLIGLWGLLLIALLPGKQPVYGLTMAALGLVMAAVGFDPTGQSARWTFGIDALESGIGILPMLLGLFTLAEIIQWMRRVDLNQPASWKPARDDSILRGVKAVFRHWKLTLRSALTGTTVGIIPGIGGTAASFIAYAQAGVPAQNKQEQTAYGSGNIRGLIAPEAAIDAKDGGSLLPAIALGLPGSEAGILLIAVFTIHGITPGASMLGSELHLSLLLILGLLLSNLVTSVVGLSLTPLLARLRSLPIERLAIPLAVVSLLSILQLNGLLSDLALAIAFAVFGFMLQAYRWPIIPLVIAFTLGSFIETNLTLSLQLIDAGRIDPFSRPGALTILTLIAFSILFFLYRYSKTRIGAQQARRNALSRQNVSGDLDDRVPALIVLVIAALVAGASLLSTETPSNYPVAISGLLFVLSALSLRRAHTDSQPSASRRLWPARQHLAALGLFACTPLLVTLFGLVAGIALMAFIGHAWLARQGNSIRAIRAIPAALVYAALVMIYTELTGLYLIDARIGLIP